MVGHLGVFLKELGPKCLLTWHLPHLDFLCLMNTCIIKRDTANQPSSLGNYTKMSNSQN